MIAKEIKIGDLVLQIKEINENEGKISFCKKLYCSI